MALRPRKGFLIPIHYGAAVGLGMTDTTNVAGALACPSARNAITVSKIFVGKIFHQLGIGIGANRKLARVA